MATIVAARPKLYTFTSEDGGGRIDRTTRAAMLDTNEWLTDRLAVPAYEKPEVFTADEWDFEDIEREFLEDLALHEFDRWGFDADGYDFLGFDHWGRNREGYDRAGYDFDGLDREGYDRNGYNKWGDRHSDRSFYLGGRYVGDCDNGSYVEGKKDDEETVIEQLNPYQRFTDKIRAALGENFAYKVENRRRVFTLRRGPKGTEMQMKQLRNRRSGEDSYHEKKMFDDRSILDDRRIAREISQEVANYFDAKEGVPTPAEIVTEEQYDDRYSDHDEAADDRNDSHHQRSVNPFATLLAQVDKDHTRLRRAQKAFIAEHRVDPFAEPRMAPFAELRVDRFSANRFALARNEETRRLLYQLAEEHISYDKDLIDDDLVFAANRVEEVNTLANESILTLSRRAVNPAGFLTRVNSVR